VNNEEERHTRHRQDQGGSPRTATPAAAWPEEPELSLSHDDGLTGRLWTFGEFPSDEEDTAADLATGVTSLGFIRAALRRGRWVWRITAVAGLLIGLAAFKAFPPAYQAQTTILFANNPFELTANAALDDQLIAQSRTVAGAALQKLGLHEDPGIFVGNYAATVLTTRILGITVKAKSYQTAIREANALAAALLAFQKHQALQLEALDNSSLQQSIGDTKKSIASLTARIESLSSQPPSPAERAQMGSLRAQRNEAKANLTALQQSNLGYAASLKANTAALINGSHVLDPAGPLPQHEKKYLLLYVGGGLVAGLALGLSIVIIRALVSDRLRRRDDVARALGAPVKLSVGKVKSRRWRPDRLEAAQGTEIRRIVSHLSKAVPAGSPGMAALAVVPVDEPQVAALSLTSLAVSTAKQGFKVVMADLCPGSPAARLLGAADPGVQSVQADDTHLVVVIPDPDDVELAGPLRQRSRRDDTAEPLAAACESADLLLTLATLDPSLGGEYLASWTRGAVVVVTAGRSSAERVHAVGEMLRLAGVDLISAVLIGADTADESLGLLPPSSLSASVGRGLGS
jgi:capsular polysaccharide biosynthesis protein